MGTKTLEETGGHCRCGMPCRGIRGGGMLLLVVLLCMEKPQESDVKNCVGNLQRNGTVSQQWPRGGSRHVLHCANGSRLCEVVEYRFLARVWQPVCCPELGSEKCTGSSTIIVPSNVLFGWSSGYSSLCWISRQRLFQHNAQQIYSKPLSKTSVPMMSNADVNVAAARRPVQRTGSLTASLTLCALLFPQLHLSAPTTYYACTMLQVLVTRVTCLAMPPMRRRS